MKALAWLAVGLAMVTLTLMGLMAGSRTDFLLGVTAATLLYIVAEVTDRERKW